MKIVSIRQLSFSPKSVWMYTVEISQCRHIDVKLDENAQTLSIQPLPDGSEVYDPRHRTPIKSCIYDKDAVARLVVNAYCEKDKLQKVTETVKAKIDKLGFYGFLYGPCCKKGIVCTCGRLSPPGTSLRECRYCLNCGEEEEVP